MRLPLLSSPHESTMWIRPSLSLKPIESPHLHEPRVQFNPWIPPGPSATTTSPSLDRVAHPATLTSWMLATIEHNDLLEPGASRVRASDGRRESHPIARDFVRATANHVPVLLGDHLENVRANPPRCHDYARCLQGNRVIPGPSTCSTGALLIQEAYPPAQWGQWKRP